MRRPRLRTLLQWPVLLALPLLLCLALAYALSVLHYRSATLEAAQINARRIGGILEQGDGILEFLERSTAGQCSSFAVTEMARAVFQSVYFREAGIERDGHLQCTSVGQITPPLEIDNSTLAAVATLGRLELLAPKQTLQGGQSIILNRALNQERTAFVNLLLNPQVLVEMLDFHPDLQAVTMLELDGRLLALDSAPPVPAATLKAPLRAGVQVTANGLAAIAQTDGLPIFTVVTVSDAQILTHWRTRMQPAVAAGFAVSLLALLLLRRYLPKQDAEEDLRQAIDARELEVWFQPVIDARTGRSVGAEALVRWRHPKRGLVMPDEFIPLAERNGLILPLTEEVLRQVKLALEQLAPMPPEFRLHVNLSGPHLADDSLLIAVNRIFGVGSSLHRLGFEITERELLAHVADKAREIVLALGLRGAEVSLDDFGTGYSGLTHLRHLPLHRIKIDRSFVWALDTEAVTASLVDNIVRLAQVMNLGLIAEGVETQAQQERLLALGVNLHQGWLYAKAMPLEAFCTYLDTEKNSGPKAAEK